MEKLFENLKLFNDSENEIEEIALDILAIEFHPNNFFVISQKLEAVNRIMDNLSTNRSTDEWKEYWKYKLTEIVGLIWKQAMLKGISIPMTIHSTFSNGSCVYNPELSEIKEKYMKELKSYVGWPSESRFLNGSSIIEEET